MISKPVGNSAGFTYNEHLLSTIGDLLSTKKKPKIERNMQNDKTNKRRNGSKSWR